MATIETLTFGEQLRQLREERGLSLRDVAMDKEELTHGGLSKIERGERQPTSTTLEAIARALDVRFVIDRHGLRFDS